MTRARYAAIAILVAAVGLLSPPRSDAQVQNPLSIKPLIRGLVSMERINCLSQADNHCVNDNSIPDAYSMPNILRGVVINITWAQLQPTPGIFDPQAIDAALAQVATYNSKYPDHPLSAILRIEGASVAPDWVKQLDGGPVSIAAMGNRRIAVPLFWTADYQNAWRALQAQLAAKYDRNPLVAQISNTSCSHLSDEPYVHPHDDPPSFIALYDKGYSNQQYVKCLRDSIHDYDAWRVTRVDFAQNPFENISVRPASGHQEGVYGPLDLSTTVEIMKAFRSALGERAIISNHNLLSPPFKPNVDLYKAMQALGPPIEFQTASAGVNLPNAPPTGYLKDWDSAIRLGVGVGATAVEVWSSFAFKGNPINNGWNPMPCNADVPRSGCSGRPPTDLLRWNKELETGNPYVPGD